MWIEKKPIIQKHECAMPSIDEVKQAGAGLGSIWECDNCGKRWKLTFLGNVVSDFSPVMEDALAK
jgi:ribosomal protein L37AE/L43A